MECQQCIVRELSTLDIREQVVGIALERLETRDIARIPVYLNLPRGSCIGMRTDERHLILELRYVRVVRQRVSIRATD